MESEDGHRESLYYSEIKQSPDELWDGVASGTVTRIWSLAFGGLCGLGVSELVSLSETHGVRVLLSGDGMKVGSANCWV